jgi:Putative lumazine-binding
MDAVEPTDQYDIDSYDAIYKVVDLAMKGAAEGDLAKLGAAFHADARMYGEVYGQRYDEPIAAFFDLCKRHPSVRAAATGRALSTSRVWAPPPW